MTLEELEALEAEYETAGFRVRFVHDGEECYLPAQGEPGVQTRDQAEALLVRLSRVAKLRGFTGYVVVGPDLEPAPQVSETPQETGETPDPNVAIFKALQNVLSSLSTSAPQNPQRSENDYEKAQRNRYSGLPKNVVSYIQSEPKIDPDLLVNPEALNVGLRDRDE